jgi:hypothetical protein
MTLYVYAYVKTWSVFSCIPKGTQIVLYSMHFRVAQRADKIMPVKVLCK